MSSIDILPQRNLWLKALSQSDLALLTPDLLRVPIERDLVLVQANVPQTHVYFPEGGIVSIVTDSIDVGMTEVGIFGREGMSSASALLGVECTPQRTFVQIEGASALRIPLKRMRSAIALSPTLQASVAHYLYTLLTQLSSSIVSNTRHPLEARLARWLLMCHDRLDGDEIALTHEFMAAMIGAQRTGVTVTLHVLEGDHLIQSKRGRVIILDRTGLEQLAGSAYGTPEAEYRRLIGDFGRSTTTTQRAVL